MKTDDAIKKAGSRSNLAKLLGVSKSAVSQWGDELPEGRKWQLKATKPTWFKKPKPEPTKEA